jgi:hypothetical protein
MTKVSDLSHDEISVVAANKLCSLGYIASMANVTIGAGGEQPDAIGVKSCGESFLVEVKVSRADFLADKKKPWRKSDFNAYGSYRAYLTPKGLLSPDEIPYGWQLWEVHGVNKPQVKVIKGAIKVKHPDYNWKATEYVNCDSEEYCHFRDKVNYRGMLGLMATIMSRMSDDGISLDQYANRSGKGWLKPSKKRVV